MSNRVTLQRTVFQNVRQDGTEAEKSFGYRMYDDYGQTYDNTLEAEQVQVSDEELLRYVRDNGNEMTDEMISFLRDSDGHGLYIDDNWHDWEWVKKALDITD